MWKLLCLVRLPLGCLLVFTLVLCGSLCGGRALCLSQDKPVKPVGGFAVRGSVASLASAQAAGPRGWSKTAVVIDYINSCGWSKGLVQGSKTPVHLAVYIRVFFVRNVPLACLALRLKSPPLTCFCVRVRVCVCVCARAVQPGLDDPQAPRAAAPPPAAVPSLASARFLSWAPRDQPGRRLRRRSGRRPSAPVRAQGETAIRGRAEGCPARTVTGRPGRRDGPGRVPQSAL